MFQTIATVHCTWGKTGFLFNGGERIGPQKPDKSETDPDDPEWKKAWGDAVGPRGKAHTYH